MFLLALFISSSLFSVDAILLIEKDPLSALSLGLGFRDFTTFSSFLEVGL
tara:strand:+ start:640 stop:789 length:150 start_codon:yes stop_codon:yes gene_type:complete